MVWPFVNEKDILLISKKKGIFSKLFNKRFNEINRLRNEFDFNDLHYFYNQFGHITKSDAFISPLSSYI